jgi:hypothetical protein
MTVGSGTQKNLTKDPMLSRLFKPLKGPSVEPKLRSLQLSDISMNKSAWDSLLRIQTLPVSIMTSAGQRIHQFSIGIENYVPSQAVNL